MKKILAIMLALVIMSASAFAEMLDFGTAEQQPELWYELSADDTVLTVRLPGNTKTGLTWNFEISDPMALELLTCETIEGESEGMAGTPTTFVASFRAIGDAENTASLILRCADETDPAAAAVYTRVLQLAIDADNKLSVNSVLMQEPFADWCEYGDDGCVLTVRMPDEAWNFEIIDEGALELITCDSSDGAFVASFMATMSVFGDSYLLFTSEDGLHTRSVNVFVNESGMIEVTMVETFDIVTDAEMVQCEVCLGWFEAGNIFRNHICLVDNQPAQGAYFTTVNVTGSSVNMRSGAGTEHDVVAVLTEGTNARYLDRSATDSKGSEWYMISVDNKTGWISSGYAKLGGNGYVKITGASVNMRTEPNTDCDIITVISEGTIVTYLGTGYTDTRDVNWYKVKLDGKEGWVSAQYAKFVPSNIESVNKEYKFVQIKGGDCNLRKSPDVDSKSLMSLKEGEVGKCEGKKATDDRGVVWYKVTFDGKTGWVSSKYAKLLKTDPNAPEVTPEPVQPEVTPTPAPTDSPSSNNGGFEPVEKEEEPEDMRLVYNPNRYDVIRITNITLNNDNEFVVTCTFGTIDKNGDPRYFDDADSVTLKLVAGAEVMLPGDKGTFEESRFTDDLKLIKDPADWFSRAKKGEGKNFHFYATFSMNEAGSLRNIVYLEVEE